MKGVIFNLLEEIVLEEFGEETWLGLLDDSGASGSYTSLGNYPDRELLGLVSSAAKALQVSDADVLRLFGERAFPRLAARYPALVQDHATPNALLLSVNTLIHPEVRKLYPGAVCPHFGFAPLAGANTVRLSYHSPRQLCSLVEGFLRGVAVFFRTEVAITHEHCTHEGAAECRLAVAWAS